MSEDTERPASPAAPPGSVPAQRTARQRRPTGAPPPLPRPVRVSTTAWLVLAVVIVTYVRDKEGQALCGRGASCPG